jgi:hypothetical protein
VSPLTVVIGAFVVGAIVGSIAVPGAPIFALPIAAIGLIVLAVSYMRRGGRRSSRPGEAGGEAQQDEIEFTARDKETLA